MKPNKNKKIERAIRLTYDSLQSHLFGTYTKTPEGKRFHKNAIKDYLEILNILTELL